MKPPPQQPPPPPPPYQPSSYQQQQQPSSYQPYGGGYYNPQQQQQYSQYSHHHNAPPPPHPQQAASGVVQSFDVESQQHNNNNNLYATPFADKYVRAGFIRKTYALLLMQLAFTFGLTFLFVFYPPIRDYIRSPAGMWMFAASWAVGFGTLISLVCCCQAAIRQHPTNLIIMFIFTLAMGFMVATVAAFYNEQAVLIAVGTTFALTLGLTLFAIQTKIDFTLKSGLLFTASLSVLLFALLAIVMQWLLGYSSILRIAVAVAIAGLFSAFLVYDTQLIVGGKHARGMSYTPDDYVAASISLYLDVINIFLSVLSITGAAQG